MQTRELTWGDVFEAATEPKPLTTEEVVNCLFASFQDMLEELQERANEVRKAA